MVKHVLPSHAYLDGFLSSKGTCVRFALAGCFHRTDAWHLRMSLISWYRVAPIYLGGAPPSNNNPPRDQRCLIVEPTHKCAPALNGYSLPRPASILFLSGLARSRLWGWWTLQKQVKRNWVVGWAMAFWEKLLISLALTWGWLSFCPWSVRLFQAI